jgi:hypothetical protein
VGTSKARAGEDERIRSDGACVCVTSEGDSEDEGGWMRAEESKCEATRTRPARQTVASESKRSFRGSRGLHYSQQVSTLVQPLSLHL